MMNEQQRTSQEPTVNDHPGKTRIPSGYNGVYAVPTTPYSVFVHHSPVYITSKLWEGRRPGRPSSRPISAGRRPYRPDAYPYANRRWSRYLTGERSQFRQEADV